jgi:hypothetical protein
MSRDMAPPFAVDLVYVDQGEASSRIQAKAKPEFES